MKHGKRYWSFRWYIRWFVPLPILVRLSARMMSPACGHVWYEDDAVRVELRTHQDTP